MSKKYFRGLGNKISKNAQKHKVSDMIKNPKNTMYFSLWFLTIIGIFVNISLINASIVLGNNSNVDTYYSGGESLRGFVNLSIIRESNNSMFTSDYGDMSLDEFLKNNVDVVFSCNPADCLNKLSISGSDLNTNTYNLNAGSLKTIGIRLQSEGFLVSGIESFQFNVSSDGTTSCIPPLRIDVMDNMDYEYVMSNASLNNFCYIKSPYGCFNEADSSSSDEIIEKYEYCENTNITPVKSYKLGAKLILNASGSHTPEFQMSLNVNGVAKSCKAEPDSNSEISCTVNLDESLTDITPAEICMKTDDLYDAVYKIKYETNRVCGYIRDLAGTENGKDLQIYVYPLKYQTLNKIKFNHDLIRDQTTSFEEDVDNYIQSRYSGNCTPECIIPITFYSGISQHLTISNINISYLAGGGRKNTNTFGELGITSPLITTNGFQKFKLNNGNFIAPDDPRNYQFLLKFNDQNIFRQNFSVGNIPTILDIIPHEPPGLVRSLIIAVLDREPSISRYVWKFGADSPVETNGSSVRYLFNHIGSTLATVTLITPSGNKSKSVMLNVVAPSVAINQTIQEYRSAISNFSSQLNSLSQNIASEINGDKKFVDTEYLTAEINRIDRGYQLLTSSQDNEKVQLMNELLALEIPYKIVSPQLVPYSEFLVNGDQINSALLEEFGIGTYGSNDSTKILNGWLNSKLNISFDSKSYSILFKSGRNQFVFTDITLNIHPLEDIDQLYIIINGDSSKIKIMDTDLDVSSSQDEQADLIKFNDLQSGVQKRIEFLYPGPVDLTDMPIVVTPDASEIVTPEDNNRCNNNGRCESNEDSENCPRDCKPWKLIILMYIILGLIAIIAYVLLQEWYKRYYESYLFDNRTQLYNLINYMNNASNQSIKKSEIFNKLKDQSWKNEQLEYAWKKYKGQRVGMWEIPVFKWLENKQVKNELLKRNAKIK